MYFSELKFATEPKEEIRDIDPVWFEGTSCQNRFPLRSKQDLVTLKMSPPLTPVSPVLLSLSSLLNLSLGQKLPGYFILLRSDGK